MNTPSMEVIFLILSGVILMAGILYWFWSHIQLTQKKVQLLENAVFELRGMLANRPPGPPSEGGGSSSTDRVVAVEAPRPTTIYKDLGDEEDEDWSDGPAPANNIAHVSTSLDALDGDSSSPAVDLTSGGPPVDTPVVEMSIEQKLAERTQQESQFRDLFVATEGGKKEVESNTPLTQQQQTSLDGMSVKELRRLAEERGIAGAAEMKKKEILSALRSQIPEPVRSLNVADLVNDSTVVVEKEAEAVVEVEAEAIPVLE
jgi:hypothetical protein